MGLVTFPTYGDPNYKIRRSVESAAMHGAAATFKWVAYANQQAFSVTTFLDTIGTSTYTSTTSAQTVSLYVVTDTSTTSTVGLTTTTYGPWVAGGTGSPAQAGGWNVNVLSTAMGGVLIPAYSEVYFQLGTDATATVVASLDYHLAPLAAVQG